MPPGPKPKPPHLKLLEGNPGKRPVNTAAPKPAPVAPKAPNWSKVLPGDTDEAAQVRRDAAAEWKRVVPVLDSLGLLSTVDNTVLVDYCITWARILQCERQLSIEGLTKETDRGPAKNPVTTIVGQYRSAMKGYTGELGLGPSSRGRLAIPGSASDDDAAFFNY